MTHQTFLLTDASRYSICSLARYWSEANSQEKIILLGDNTDIDYFWKQNNTNSQILLIEGRIKSTWQLETLLLHENCHNIVVGLQHGLKVRECETYIRMMMQSIQNAWLKRQNPLPYRMHILLQDQKIWIEHNKIILTHAAGWAASYGILLSISLFPSIYGMYQDSKKRIPSLICSALFGNRLPIYGDGSEAVQHLHISDLAYASKQIINRENPGEACYIAGQETQEINLVYQICRILDQLFHEDTELAQLYPSSPMAHGNSALNLVTLVQERRQTGRPSTYNFNELPNIWPQLKLPQHSLEQTLPGIVKSYIQYFARKTNDKNSQQYQSFVA